MGRAFISYKRSDSAADTRSLYLALSKEFGASALFLDVVDIAGGVDWKEEIRAAIVDSSALIAVLGPKWAQTEMVEFEITLALERKVPVLPVMAPGADINALTADLGEPVGLLRTLNGRQLDYASWENSVAVIVEWLRDRGIEAVEKSDTQDELDRLAVRYEQVRVDNDPGKERTAAMTGIVGEMIDVIAADPAVDLGRWLRSDSMGRRLVGYVAVYANPNPIRATELAHTISVRGEEQDRNFGQYWGLRALRAIAKADPDAIDIRTRHYLRHQLELLSGSSHRANEVRAILELTAG